MRLFFNLLRKDIRGAVIIEFALWSSLFFVVVLAGLDYGQFLYQRSKINEAVATAALSSFNKRDEVNFSAIPDYVRAMANDPELDVTTSCNGIVGGCSNNNRNCACLNERGDYTSAICGAPCSGTGGPDNTQAGYYLTISARRSNDPMLILHGVMSKADQQRSATIRLQ